MSLIPGRYQMDKRDNFDGYMRAAGFNEEEVHNGNISTAILEYTLNNDGSYTKKTISTVIGRRVKENTFKIDEDFHEVSINGREVISTISMDGPNKWIHKQIAVKKPGNRFNKDVTWINTFTEEGMYMECECDGVVGNLFSKRLQ